MLADTLLPGPETNSFSCACLDGTRQEAGSTRALIIKMPVTAEHFNTCECFVPPIHIQVPSIEDGDLRLVGGARCAEPPL
jgi:hypothetical protein